MELNVPVFDFRSGILTRKLISRPDLGIYKSGVLVGHNFLTQIQGPTTYRPGNIFVRKTRRRKKPFFLPFVFNADQSYVLEFTEGYLRFYTDDGILVEDAKTITDITAASPGVITSNTHGYSSGDEIYIDGIVGTTELNGKYFLVVYIDANTYSLTDDYGNAIDTTSLTAYASGGTTQRVYELTTPYLEEHLPDLQIGGRFDVRYITNVNDYAPRKLVRAGATSWTLGPYTRTEDPFGQYTITGITAASPGAVTCVGHPFSTGDVVVIENVSGMIEVNNETFTITKTGADTFTLGVDTSGYTAYTSGGICAVSGDYPASVAVYGSRLFFGGRPNAPDILDGSKSPNSTTGEPQFDDFTLGSDPEDAVTYPLTSINYSSIAVIKYITGTRDFLLVGTQGGCLRVTGGGNSVPVSGTAIQSDPIDSYGAAGILPAVFGTDVLYVQRGKEVLLSFKYSWQNDGYESFSENIQSDEITNAGITQIVYQQGKPGIVWCVLSNGGLASLTYKRTEDISAWNTHDLSGGEVATIATQPQSDNEDRIWIGVKRTVMDQDEYYVEYSAKTEPLLEIEDVFTGDKDLDNTKYADLTYEALKRDIFLESALTLDTTQNVTITPGALTGTAVTFTAGSSLFTSSDVGRWIMVKYVEGGEKGIAEITAYTSGTVVTCKILQDFLSTDTIAAGEWYLTVDEVSGLDHLEGEEVGILADGNVAPVQTVAGGKVSLPAQTTYVVVGLKYNGIVKTMPIEILMSSGVTPGKVKTLSQVAISVRNTLGVEYGHDLYKLTKLSFRKAFSRRPPLPFTGARNVPAFDKYGEYRSLYIVQREPRRCTLTSLALDIDVAFEE